MSIINVNDNVYYVKPHTRRLGCVLKFFFDTVDTDTIRFVCTLDAHARILRTAALHGLVGIGQALLKDSLDSVL